VFDLQTAQGVQAGRRNAIDDLPVQNDVADRRVHPGNVMPEVPEYEVAGTGIDRGDFVDGSGIQITVILKGDGDGVRMLDR
jgi:hypothetical protein